MYQGVHAAQRVAQKGLVPQIAAADVRIGKKRKQFFRIGAGPDQHPVGLGKAVRKRFPIGGQQAEEGAAGFSAGGPCEG